MPPFMRPPSSMSRYVHGRRSPRSNARLGQLARLLWFSRFLSPLPGEEKGKQYRARVMMMRLRTATTTLVGRGLSLSWQVTIRPWQWRRSGHAGMRRSAWLMTADSRRGPRAGDDRPARRAGEPGVDRRGLVPHWWPVAAISEQMSPGPGPSRKTPTDGPGHPGPPVRLEAGIGQAGLIPHR